MMYVPVAFWFNRGKFGTIRESNQARLYMNCVMRSTMLEKAPFYLSELSIK